MTEDRARAFVPIESLPLPRPLRRFGPAFPSAVARHYASLYVPRGGAVADPLAYPYSAADAVERSGGRGLGGSDDALAAWARRAVRAAPSEEETLAALERVGDSLGTGRVPHRVAMRELYTSSCRTCHAPVVIEAFVWERDVPARAKRAFRCEVCARDGRSLLVENAGTEDSERSRTDRRGPAFRDLVDRFGDDRRLGESVALLYTPRNLQALMATVRAVESVAEGPAGALLRLALVEVIVCGSSDGAPLLIERGRARRRRGGRRRREVNVWLEFQRTVGELAAWLEADASSRALRPDDAVGTAGGVTADLVLFAAPTEDLLGGWAAVASAICLGAGAPRERDHGPPCPRARVRTALAEGRARSREGAPAVVYMAPAAIPALAACALAGADTGYDLDSIQYQPDALGPRGVWGQASAAVLTFRRAAPESAPAAADVPATLDAMRSGIAAAIAARGEPVGADHAGVAALEALGVQRMLGGLVPRDGAASADLFMEHLDGALGWPGASGIRRVAADGRTAYSLRNADAGAFPLGDRVEWAVWGLLSAARSDDTPGFLRHAYEMFPGLLTPERELVEACLASYGARDPEGRWDLRPADALRRRQAGRAVVLAGLVDVGRRLGFEVAVGRDQEIRALAPPPGGERPADLVPGSLAVALGRIIETPPQVAEALDCVWYGRGGMVFVWQVDWTARLHRSLVELGEAIRDDLRTFRFLAIADERHDLVAFKLRRSPGLRELVARRAWRFVGWEALRRLAGSPCGSLADLEPIVGLRTAREQPRHQTVFHW